MKGKLYSLKIVFNYASHMKGQFYKQKNTDMASEANISISSEKSSPHLVHGHCHFHSLSNTHTHTLNRNLLFFLFLNIYV